MPAIVAPVSTGMASRTDVQRSASTRADFSGVLAERMRATERAGVDANTGNVPALRTPLEAGEAAAAIARALEHATGAPPNPRTVTLLTAQWAHETAFGRSMFNYNFAGIKGQGPSGLSVVQRTREFSGKDEITIRDRFRAYETPEQGAGDYIRLLRVRYPAALEAAERGDVQAFVGGLKAGRYFTGDEAAYTRAIASISEKLAPGSFDLGAAPRPAAPLAVARPPRTGAEATTSIALHSLADASAIAEEIARAALAIAAHPDRDRTGSGAQS